MRYEFQLVGGREVVEKYFPAAEAPDIGAVVEIEGRQFVRIMSCPGGVYDNTNTRKYPCEDLTIPRETETPGGKGPRGFPVFNSQKEHKEFGHRHGFGWD